MLALADQAKAPGREAIEAALNRIQSQPEFQSSTRLSEFLRFIVFESLAGRAANLKAVTIAIAVYGRDETFDAQSNSIVRVEATRLRRLLDRYYSAEGADDPLIISIPRGGYTPEFSLRDSPGEGTGGNPAPASVRQEKAGSQARALNKLAAALALVVVIGGSVFWGTYFSGQQSSAARGRVAGAPASYQPTLHIETVTLGASGGGAPDRQALQNRLAFETALERFEDLRIVENGTGSQQKTDYRLQIFALAAERPERGYVARMVHNPSSEIIWTSQVGNALAGTDPVQKAAAIQGIADAIARPFGVIFSDQRRRLRGQPNDRFGCIIDSHLYFARPSKPGFLNAKSCLENALKTFPQFGAGIATLALLRVSGWQNGFELGNENIVLEEINQLANRAQLLNPKSVRANLAVFQGEFLRKNYATAFQIGDTLLATNGDVGGIAATVAGAYVMRGDLDKARALIQAHRKKTPGFGSVYGAALFTIAYSREQKDNAARWAMARGVGFSPYGLLAQVIVSHQRGKLDEADRAIKRLQSSFPEVFRDVGAALDRLRMAEPLRSKILQDLHATGLVSTLRTPNKDGASQAGSAANAQATIQ